MNDIVRFGNWDILDDLFAMSGMARHMECRTPNVDIVEGNQSVDIVVDAPGYETSDIDVSVENGVLTFSGKKISEKEDSGKTFARKERREAAFARSFSLGDGFDHTKIKAVLAKGILTITVPKITQEKTPTQNKIQIEQG